ncbi:hypothetical protein BRD19_02390 [Halobacteriales archaeon SW_7_65_23]|jgi:hypothetical protein|nr:MAG: hypothetical protein BRD19_02390 [Halobacteriales archaeon SW_7_65_23]
MSLDDRLRQHVREHKSGMLYDLMFAVVWVGLVAFLSDFVSVGAPTWAFYTGVTVQQPVITENSRRLSVIRTPPAVRPRRRSLL